MCRTGGWRSLPWGSPHPTHTALCQCWGAACNECMRMGWDGTGRSRGCYHSSSLGGDDAVGVFLVLFFFVYFISSFVVWGCSLLLLLLLFPSLGKTVLFLFCFLFFCFFFCFSFLFPFFLPEICTSARCVLGSVIKRSRCAAHTARCRRLPARPAPPLGRETKKKEKE